MPFRNALAAKFGMELPATLIFDHPAPQSLAAHIASELRRQPVVGNGNEGPLSLTTSHTRPQTLPLEELQQRLNAMVSATMGSDVESVHQPLMEAGMDSISLVELR